MNALSAVAYTLAAQDVLQALQDPEVYPEALARGPAILQDAAESIAEHAANYADVAPLVVDAVWPDTFSLVPPRDPEDREADPVMEVLSLSVAPWLLKDVWISLRRRGLLVPTRAEAESAIALHWLLGFALRHGADWRDRAVEQLKAWKAEDDAKAAKEN